jgi:hypothetical protein
MCTVSCPHHLAPPSECATCSAQQAVTCCTPCEPSRTWTACLPAVNVCLGMSALPALPGDEARLHQVFRSFDRDQSGSLELGEVMVMCRQLAGLSYHEALFVQVGGWDPA